MVQILIPVADQTTGSWTTTPLWSKVDDDSTVNPTGDGTTIASEEVGNNTDTTFAVLQLATGNTPDAGTQTLRVRWNHNQSGRTMAAHCELWEGIPGIGGEVGSIDITPDVGTTETESTTTTISGISDYSNLYVRLWGRGTGGGPGRSLIVDLVELEIPDGGATVIELEGTSGGVGSVVGELFLLVTVELESNIDGTSAAVQAEVAAVVELDAQTVLHPRDHGQGPPG